MAKIIFVNYATDSIFNQVPCKALILRSMSMQYMQATVNLLVFERFN